MPIIITSALQLAQIGISPDYPENGSYVLGNDIQITGNWVSLPALDGISFNGNGYRIYTLNAPLFSSLKNAAISNLILDAAIDNTVNYEQTCALVRSAIFSSFQSITITGSINSNFIAGGLSVDIVDSQIVDCYNYASITSQQGLAGGITAFANDSSLIGCVNNGAITANNNRGGGLVAQFQTRGISQVDGPPSKFFITDSVNNGPVQAYENGGGLVGFLADDGFFLEHVNLGTEIHGCINRGNVSPATEAIGSPNGNNYFGGLVGGVSLDHPNGGGFFDCENSGNISGGGFIGGIIGNLRAYEQETGEERNYRLHNCRNSGDITLNAAPPLPPQEGNAVFANVGGIAGEISFTGTIDGCINNGAITSNGPDSGGIAGRALYCLVENCVNQGVISGMGNCGGIAGQILNGVRVLNNKSCATVTSTGQFVGGIAGLVAQSMENGAIIYPNEIRDNLVSCPSISGAASVYRVLGGSADINISLFNTQVFPDILLSGNNSADGGLIYNNQPVAAGDPQLGAVLRQGATLVCAPGEYLKSCVGCVPQHLPCPCGECSCMPGRCRPCNGRDGNCLSQENSPQRYSLSAIGSPITGKNRIPSQVLRV